MVKSSDSVFLIIFSCDVHNYTLITGICQPFIRKKCIFMRLDSGMSESDSSLWQFDGSAPLYPGRGFGYIRFVKVFAENIRILCLPLCCQKRFQRDHYGRGDAGTALYFVFLWCKRVQFYLEPKPPPKRMGAAAAWWRKPNRTLSMKKAYVKSANTVANTQAARQTAWSLRTARNAVIPMTDEGG